MNLKALPAAVLLFAAAPLAAAANTVTFAPHRAVYDITLGKAASGSGVSEMTGRMVYELTGSACEGFTQNMRFVTRMINQEGGATVNDLRTSSWEEQDGKRLRFSSTQYQNDKVDEASQGDAKRSGAETAVDLVQPEKKIVTLPANVYFPMQHATALIQSAKDGKTIFAADIFDGSEKGEKFYKTNAVIGKKFEQGAVASTASIADAARLAALDSWPVTISYFDAGKDKQDTIPVYELAFRYYENGVTTDLKIDYGDFVLSGELKELTLLPAASCPPPG